MAASPETCPLCALIGEKRTFYFDTFIHFPDEIAGLPVVASDDASRELRQCRRCGQFYEFEYRHDNELFAPAEVVSYRRISPELAEQIIRSAKSLPDAAVKSSEPEALPVQGARCPQCRAEEVTAQPVGIEFTKMTCLQCGYFEVADVWERSEWYLDG